MPGRFGFDDDSEEETTMSADKAYAEISDLLAGMDEAVAPTVAPAPQPGLSNSITAHGAITASAPVHYGTQNPFALTPGAGAQFFRNSAPNASSSPSLPLSVHQQPPSASSSSKRSSSVTPPYDPRATQVYHDAVSLLLSTQGPNKATQVRFLKELMESCHSRAESVLSHKGGSVPRRLGLGPDHRTVTERDSDFLDSDARLERSAWSLVETLFDAGGSDLLINESPSPHPHPPRPNSSPSQYVFDVLSSQPHQRRGLILSWLESDACERVVYYQVPSAPPQHLWPSTAEQNRSSLKGQAKQSPPSLDPDLELRDPTCVAPEDRAFDKMLLSTCFDLIRAGRLPAAALHARALGQLWREATFLGGAPVADNDRPVSPPVLCRCAEWKQNSASSPQARHEAYCMGGVLNPTPGTKGNPNVALWRKTCRLLSKEMATKFAKPSTDLSSLDAATYEAAIYAALSNDHESLLSSQCCKSRWEDRLWVLYRALQSRAVDEALETHRLARQSEGQRYPVPPYAPAEAEAAREQLEKTSKFASNTADIERRLFEDAMPAGTTLQVYRQAMKAVALGAKELHRFFNSTLSSENSEVDRAQSLRFLAHFAIFVSRVIPYVVTKDVLNTLVSKYVRVLEANRALDFVAVYCKLLEKDTRVVTYTDFITTVRNAEDRHRMFHLGKEHFPDLMREILLRAVVSSRESVSHDDDSKMSSLEWLLISDDRMDRRKAGEEYRVEALVHTNCLLRRLLLEKKLATAKMLVGIGHSRRAVLPTDTLDVVSAQVKRRLERLELDPEDLADQVRVHFNPLAAQAQNEYESWESFLDAEYFFNEVWLRTKTAVEREADPQVEKAGDRLRKGAEVFEAKTNEVEAKLLKILSGEELFLSDEETSGTPPTAVFTAHIFSERFSGDYASRGEQLVQLKMDIVPYLIGLLHDVYDGAGRYFAFKVGDKAKGKLYFEKALRIGSLIADESSGFLKFIDDSNLRTIVKRISESAVEMLRCEN